MATATLDRNFAPSDAVDEGDWRAYFREYDEHQRLVTAARASVQLDDDGNEIEPEPDVVVVRPAEAMTGDGLPRSAKAIWKRLAARPGWVLDAQVTSTQHAPVLYKATKDGHTQGDVYKPSHEEHHLWVRGVLAGDKTVAAFVVEYRYDCGLKTAAWKFENAQWQDIVNNERRFEKAVKPFDDWISVFAPKPAPTPKKSKVTEK